MTDHPRRPCSRCGEQDRKVKTVTVHVDGKKMGRWRLCAVCRAMSMDAFVTASERKK